MLEFILTVLLLELTPGPNMAYLATLTLDRGRRAGLLATAGVAAGLSVHAIVAAFGLGVLISQAPLLYNLLRWTGVADLYVPRLGNLAVERKGCAGWGGSSIQAAVSSLLVQATQLGTIYVAIATTIHASIVLLASQLRPLLIAGAHEKTIRRILPLLWSWLRRGSPGRQAWYDRITAELTHAAPLDVRQDARPRLR